MNKRIVKNIVKKSYLIALASVILLVLLFIVKINTMIYVGHYSSLLYDYDIVLKIDDREILNDTLISFPFRPQFEIEEKLKCGFHKVSVYSNRANIYQEGKIFLLPNQHISLELLLADTLSFYNYSFPDSIIHNIRCNKRKLPDSIIELYRNPSRYYDSLFQKFLDVPIASEKSRFDIDVGCNPFRTK